MQSTFSVHPRNKYNAETYSKLNDLQLQFGKQFLTSLKLERGQKVMDMGCGTGELTSIIAQKVGHSGQVIGMDPDKERIDVAKQKHSGFDINVSFTVGDSISESHYLENEYYDVHFSNFVFQWLTTEEKEIFVKTAFRCLKTGGRIAIQCHEKDPLVFREVSELLQAQAVGLGSSTSHLVSKSFAASLLQNSGFVILSSEYATLNYTFPSLDDFTRWVSVSDYLDENKIPMHKKAALINKFANKDGTVTLFDPRMYRIVAMKVIA